MTDPAGQPAKGPDDAALPASRDHAERLTAVGICPPTTSAASPAEQFQRVVLWHVKANGTFEEVTRARVLDKPLFNVGEAYFAPPSELGATWPRGRYVFEIREIGSVTSRWMTSATCLRCSKTSACRSK